MDMTEFDYTAHRATRGLGSIGDGDGRGVHVLSVLALDASTGEPLGVLPPQRWVRPDVTPGRRKAESTYARSLRARESQYWMRALRSSRGRPGLIHRRDSFRGGDRPGRRHLRQLRGVSRP